MLRPPELNDCSRKIPSAILDQRVKAARHYRPSNFNGYWEPWLKIYDRLEDRIISLDSLHPRLSISIPPIG